MKKCRFTEGQIIGMLKQDLAGIQMAELRRKHGILGAAFSDWRGRCSGMEVLDAWRQKSLEDENRQLKRLVAELILDVATQKEALGKF
jgi:putative transposase